MTLRAAAGTRAARAWELCPELGPRSAEGAGSSLCGNASAALLLSPPRHGGRSEFSHPRPKESNSLVWRVAEVAKEEAGASRRRRRHGRGAGSPERSLRLPPERPLQPRGARDRGCPAPYRKSTRSHRPASNARGRGAGLPSQPLGGRGARTGPSPPLDFHLPPGKTWEPRPSRGWGRRRRPGEPHWDPGLGSGLGPAPAGLQVSRGAGAGTRRADLGSRAPPGRPRRAPGGRRNFGALRGGRTLPSYEASAGKQGGRSVSARGGPERRGPGRRRPHLGFPRTLPERREPGCPTRPLPGPGSRWAGGPRARSSEPTL